MRFGLSSFYLYLSLVIYWFDTFMTSEGGDQEAAQAAEQAQIQLAQQYAQAQAAAQQLQRR